MSFDSNTFRNALGTFATGICVITARNTEGQPFGVTVNSFSSVSLEPALILWSLQNSSECLDSFQQADKFAVNILTTDQQNLSGYYAKKGDHLLLPEHFRIGQSSTPILRNALTTFECNSWANYPGGDHVILLGEVTGVEHNPNKKPLIFSGGKYRTLK